jgi:hypothetical protein
MYVQEERNSFNCKDDSSINISSEWSGRKSNVDTLDVIENYVVENGNCHKTMRDNGKQFTSNTFKRFIQRTTLKIIYICKISLTTG